MRPVGILAGERDEPLPDWQAGKGKTNEPGINLDVTERKRFFQGALNGQVGGDFSIKERTADFEKPFAGDFDGQTPIGQEGVCDAEIRRTAAGGLDLAWNQ